MLFEDCVDGHPPNRQHRFFQERLLLHRILFVCENDTLFFDCNTLRATSCHPDGKPYFPPPPIRQPRSRLHHNQPKLATGANPLLTYTYRTRKKIIDTENGAWKFETLVVPTPKVSVVPSVQERLELLQGVRAWRRYRGSFYRLLRPGIDGKRELQEEEYNSRWAEKMALNEAWFDLVGAYTSLERSSLTSNLDSLKVIASLIAQAHTADGSQVEFCQGLWLGLMSFSLLWFRAEPRISPSVSDGTSSRGTPTWSWAGIDAPVSHALAGTTKKLKQSEEKLERSGRQGLQHVQPPSLIQSGDQMWRAIRVIPLIGEAVVPGLPSDTGNQSLEISRFCELFPVNKVSSEVAAEMVYNDPE